MKRPVQIILQESKKTDDSQSHCHNTKKVGSYTDENARRKETAAEDETKLRTGELDDETEAGVKIYELIDDGQKYIHEVDDILLTRRACFVKKVK